MATLVVINGRHRGEWYTVPETENGLILGRSDELLAEIIDPRISRQHLKVCRHPETERFVAQDLGSHNGTRVNGHRISLHHLKDGDVIQMGHTVLCFTEEDLADQDQIDPFIEACEAKAAPLLEKINEREEYTEAASLFSRIFGSRRKRA